MNNKVFISGPITGHADWRMRFDDAERTVLHDIFFDRYGNADLYYRYGYFGFRPVNPSAFGDESKSWRWNMVRSVWKLLGCSYVFFMRGWHDSRGCRIEHTFADLFGKRIIYEEDMR